MMSQESISTLASLAALVSVLGAVISYRCLARARALAHAPRPTAVALVANDTSLRVRYLRALTAIGTTLEAMRANFERGSAVFGNVEPPVAELAELCTAAAALGRTLDVGILHATMYWLREHGYQHAFSSPSPELHECRARIDAALWETRRLMGIAQEATLPRTLADVEALAELGSPAAAPLPRERGRRVAARRDGRAAAPLPVTRTVGAH